MLARETVFQLLDIDVLVVTDIRVGTMERTYDRDDVETETVDVVIANVVCDGTAQVVALSVVNGI